MKLMQFYGKRVLLLLLAAVCLLGAAACSSPRSEKIFSLSGETIRRDDLMLYAFFSKYDYYESQIESGYMTVNSLFQLDQSALDTKVSDGVTLEDYLRGNTFYEATNAVLYRVLAKSNGLKFTSAEKFEMKSEKAAFVESFGGASGYNTFIKESGSSDDAVERYIQDAYYSMKLLTLFQDGGKYALTDAEIDALYETYAETYMTIKHIIFLKKDTELGTLLPEAALLEKQAAANAAYARLQNGESFDAVWKDVTENPDIASETVAVNNSVDANTQVLYTAAKALAVGAYSAVVENSNGYYILYRDELKTDQFSSLYTSTVYTKMSDYLSAEYAKADIKYKVSMDDFSIQ